MMVDDTEWLMVDGNGCGCVSLFSLISLLRLSLVSLAHLAVGTRVLGVGIGVVGG